MQTKIATLALIISIITLPPLECSSSDLMLFQAVFNPFPGAKLLLPSIGIQSPPTFYEEYCTFASVQSVVPYLHSRPIFPS